MSKRYFGSIRGPFLLFQRGHKAALKGLIQKRRMATFLHSLHTECLSDGLRHLLHYFFLLYKGGWWTKVEKCMQYFVLSTYYAVLSTFSLLFLCNFAVRIYRTAIK
jgi:hypothetical protein